MLASITSVTVSLGWCGMKPVFWNQEKDALKKPQCKTNCGSLARAYAVNFSGLMLVVFEGFSLDWLSSTLILMILLSAACEPVFVYGALLFNPGMSFQLSCLLRALNMRY